MNKIQNGKTLPVGGRNYDLMGMLLTPTRYLLRDGTYKLIRTTRENIERYRHLWEES